MIIASIDMQKHQVKKQNSTLNQRVITIDGPAASGKSTVSRQLAQRLEWQWVSTGAFYRGLALVAFELNVAPSDCPQLVELCHCSNWRVEMGDSKTQVFFEGDDVTDELLSEHIGSLASEVSQHLEVRKALLAPQRDCLKRALKGLVAEGRDCGSVVFPDALLKVYLTAESHKRAQRRALQAGEVNVEQVRGAQKKRDLKDIERKNAPLIVPEKGYLLDTSHLSLEEVVAHLEGMALKVIGPALRT